MNPDSAATERAFQNTTRSAPRRVRVPRIPFQTPEPAEPLRFAPSRGLGRLIMRVSRDVVEEIQREGTARLARIRAGIAGRD